MAFLHTRLNFAPVSGEFGISPAPGGKRNGAGDGPRTRDLELGRLSLFHLSYSRSRMAGISRRD